MKGIRKMKTTLTILCAMFAAFAFGAEKKQAPKKTSITESELRAMAKAKPNAKDAGALYQVGMATNNVERQQEFFKASAACLLACGKYETYKKHVKDNLSNAKAFEESLKDKCKKCGGAGRKDRKCHVCSGKMGCPSCRGSGQTVSMGFDRPNGAKPCHKCSGSGKCHKCGGAGSTKEKCGACAGTGKVFLESIAERVFRNACNAIADAKSGKQPAAGNSAMSTTRANDTLRQLGSNSKTAAAEFDKLKQYDFLVNGCKLDLNDLWIVHAECASGNVNYSISMPVNQKPQAQFKDGSGLMHPDFYTSDIVLLIFPTPESRKVWSGAMGNACNKMVEWLKTAQANKVGHVEKELPESAFNGTPAYAFVDWIDSGARQSEYYRKALAKYIDSAEFAESARRIEFRCVIDSDDNERFTVTLSFGLKGEFPFRLLTAYRKKPNEIYSAVQELLQKVDPESIADVWKSQVERNSRFSRNIAGSNSSKRLSASPEVLEDARKSARSGYNQELSNDLCLSKWWSFTQDFPIGSRNSLVIKDSAGDWNYTLWLGENGVAQIRSFNPNYQLYEYHDYVFDYHLLTFPTPESRKRWHEVVKNSLGLMLEWIDIASKERIPFVVKPTYEAGKDVDDALKAWYNLITKGQEQTDLLKKTLRTRIDRSEYNRYGLPVSLICTIKSRDANFKEFRVNIQVQCGDRYQGMIFTASGTYERIQKECIRALHKIDPDALIDAWNEKYGRQDLFK